jgi:ADP-L-glycero-D-manno-heptose 6-epimerase
MKAGKAPRVFKGGEQKRDFVYVKDVVALTIAAAAAPRSGVFNCGSGHAISFNEVIAALNEALGTSLTPEYIENPFQHFYQPHTEADMSRARTEVGFTPAWAPAYGIVDYVRSLEAR